MIQSMPIYGYHFENIPHADGDAKECLDFEKWKKKRCHHKMGTCDPNVLERGSLQARETQYKECDGVTSV